MNHNEVPSLIGAPNENDEVLTPTDSLSDYRSDIDSKWVNSDHRFPVILFTSAAFNDEEITDTKK